MPEISKTKEIMKTNVMRKMPPIWKLSKSKRRMISFAPNNTGKENLQESMLPQN